MKNKRREYTAQFYKKNHIAFAAALLSSLLTSALNLYIAWVLQQMIDAVSGVPRLLCIVCSALVRSQRHCSDHLTEDCELLFQAVLYGKSDEAI